MTNNVEYQNLTNAKFHNIFHFRYGLLDDSTYWISSTHNTLLRIDKFTLNILLNINTGTSMAEIAKKYHMELEEVTDIYHNLDTNGFIVEKNFGKIKRNEPIEDIDAAPFLFLFFIMALGQIFYFMYAAKTVILQKALEGIIVSAIAVAAIVFHELGHYFICWKYTGLRPRMRLTMLKWMPIVYVDTNMAWQLPRNKRLLISSSGILTDLVVNTIAITLALSNPSLEYYVTPLLLTQYTRIAILINPLFGGDGYWMLADLLRAINMEKRSFAELKKGRINFFSLYGLISLVFSLLCLVGFGWFIFNILHSVITRFAMPHLNL